MISGARFGSFALIVGLLCASPGSAQTETPGDTSDKAVKTETPSTWTEPPTRGAAGPKADETPVDSAAAPATTKPPTDKPTQKAAAPERTAPEAAPKRQAATPDRSAKLRREQIRVAARSRIVAESPAGRPRYGRIARAHEGETARPQAHRHIGERRTYAYRAFRPEPPRYARRFATARESADDDGAVSPYGWRRAGWGGLIDDDRERRIARARAAGYLVMRARTYGYPDGTQVREMTPYTPYGLE